RYRDLLLGWNRRFNLTAVTDPIEVERRLFLDSLRLVPTIDGLTAGQTEPRLIDIGSGGGFPGLALKIARPRLDVTLIDATGKKVRFLEEAIAALDLTGAQALQARAEDLGRDERFRGAFDLVTARAVAPLPVLLEYAMPLLRVGGAGLFPKGREIAAELAAGEGAAAILGARIESADLLPGGETRLVETRKRAPTPADYPRRTGLPAQAPLGGAGANGAAGGRRMRRREEPAAQPSPAERAGPPRRDGA
ncbi:MAG TPA: 16S rRNA (guanine(527)-N(7))-methyltransferase RsmG, partial [Thermomicrobiales bacterium]|nr:16S rRNA (guanine(527)-N(7))-methyltransferase RsmG [Thermomicrobiales bacterium]